MDKRFFIDKLDEVFFIAEKGGIYHKLIGDVEKELIQKALEKSCGNKIRAAQILGIHRNTLCAKVKKLHIDIARYKL